MEKRFNCIYCSNYCRADNNVRNGYCAKFHRTTYFQYKGGDWGRVKLNGCMYDTCSDFNLGYELSESDKKIIYCGYSEKK